MILGFTLAPSRSSLTRHGHKDRKDGRKTRTLLNACNSLLRSPAQSNSEAVRTGLGAPRPVDYGPTEIEKLDIFRTDPAKAPIFVFIHGGNWS
jgi:acetyl esterase/lipase